jgi:hypothetical protein
MTGASTWLGLTSLLTLTVLVFAGLALAQGLTCVVLDHGAPAKPLLVPTAAVVPCP